MNVRNDEEPKYMLEICMLEKRTMYGCQNKCEDVIIT